MPITEYLERNANLYGSETALIEINPELEPKSNPSWKDLTLVEGDQTHAYRKAMTWQTFDKSANKFANLLIERGVKPGDKVAILMMNCIEWLPVYFGILKTGALAVPLNFRYSSDEIEYCLRLSESGVLIFGPEFIDRLSAVRHKLLVRDYYFVGEDGPDYAGNYGNLIETQDDSNPGIRLNDDMDGAIYFSSGTTGFPKAILHSHAALVSSCITEQAHHGQTRDDIFLCIPPLYHTGAKMHWFGSLLAGSRGVLLRGASPKSIIQTASREKATICWLLVPWAQDILDAIDSGEIDLADYDLSEWRLMHIGAQPVPPSLIKRWKQRFPSHAYDTNYGLSESIGPGAVHLGVENIHKVGAIGKAGHLWQTRIADENGRNVKQGNVGELLLKGPGVMRCYYNDEKATAEVLKDGWLYTGDMAKEDDDGFIYLVDRKKDVIITGGENIYPVQIEDFLRAHEKIKDVAVIGLAEERLGEIAAAIIEPRAGYELSEDEVNEFCLELPRYKRPRKIIFTKIPRNPTGKIEKPKLRQMYAGGSVVDKQVNK